MCRCGVDAPISDSIKPLPSFIICRDLKSCLPTSRESASCRPACITALAPALWTNGPTCTLAALRRTFRWGNRLDTSVDTFYYRIRTCTPPTFYTYSLVLITFRAPHIPPHRWLPHPSLARMPLDQLGRIGHDRPWKRHRGRECDRGSFHVSDRRLWTHHLQHPPRQRHFCSPKQRLCGGR